MAEEVELNIGREWGVGKQKNGLVILVAFEEREWRIEDYLSSEKMCAHFFFLSDIILFM